MGIDAIAVSRKAPSRFVALASRSLIPMSAWLTLFCALGVAASLAMWGWRDILFVLAGPSLQGVSHAVLASLALITLAVPVVSVVGFCCASSLWDSRIGGRLTKMLLAWLPWASGVPPVVVGAALYFLLVMAGVRLSLLTAALGLIVLNAPAASARMLRILRMIPQAQQEAAAAAGAGPVFVLFEVTLPRASRELLASMSQSAADMIGQAAVVILAGGVWGVRDPLPVQIWHFASNRSLASVEAAQCIVLLALVLIFALMADALTTHPKERGLTLAHLSREQAY